MISSFFLWLTGVPTLLGLVLAMISSALLMMEISLIPLVFSEDRYFSRRVSLEAPPVTSSTPTCTAWASSAVWLSIWAIRFRSACQ